MSKIQRQFILGEEWLFIKLYTGYKTSDYVLVHIIKPIVEKLILEKIIDHWFFIRYADPHHHLRVRFHLTSLQNISQITNLLADSLKPYIEKDIIWKVQSDTYVRELERYGFTNMEDSEILFHYDSKMVMDFLGLINGIEGEKLRWLFSLKSIYSLLEVFNCTLEEKIKLMDRLKTRFGWEFNMNKGLKIQLDKKFRLYRREIELFLKENSDLEHKIIFQVVNERDEKIALISDRIEQRINNKTLNRSMNHLLGSYIHMSMNRIFKSKARMHEMVCYDFLSRIYNSMKARGLSKL